MVNSFSNGGDDFDDGSTIYITPTVYNYLTKNNRKQGDSEEKRTGPDTAESDHKIPPRNYQMDSNFTSPNSPATHPYGNYILGHASLDPSVLMYGVRGEYERKFQQYQQLWREKWEELESYNRELHKKNSQKLLKEVDRVESNFFPGADKSLFLETPCKALELNLIQCYKDNKKRPLLCREGIKQFSSCIEEHRMKLLKQ